MGAIYKCHMTPDEEKICEQLREAVANKIGFGVTLSGNRLTVRWFMPDSTGKERLVDVHMIIESVSTPEEGLIDELQEEGKWEEDK